MSKPGCIDRSLLSKELGTCSREHGTRDLGLVRSMWALLFCQVDLFIVPVASSDQQLDAAQGGRAQIRGGDGVTRPGPALRCGVRQPECRTNGGAGPANRQQGGEQRGNSSACFCGSPAWSRYGNCAGRSPGRFSAGAAGKGTDPARSPGLRGQARHRRGSEARGAGLAGWGDAGWGRWAAGGQCRPVLGPGEGSPVPAEERGPAAAGRGCSV